jgi:hypothetical protein
LQGGGRRFESGWLHRMPHDSLLDVARTCYEAYVSGDRDVVERLLAGDGKISRTGVYFGWDLP